MTLGQKQIHLRADILLRFKYRDTVKPCCPSCSLPAPPRRRLIRWAEPWGHRCPHGEPCPAFMQQHALGASFCQECSPIHVRA